MVSETENLQKYQCGFDRWAEILCMLNMQRERAHDVAELLDQGYSTEEARALARRHYQPFRPAYINGRPKTESIRDGDRSPSVTDRAEVDD